MLDVASFARDRHEIIRQKLKTEGRVYCTQLSADLQVSEHTIRRDLQDLAEEGICRRVHGGAISSLSETANFGARLQEQRDTKDLLGEAGAKLIRDGACVFFDAGTTNLAVARAIPADLRFTAVTNTPSIAVELLKHPHVEVIMLGGRLRRSTGGALGITALKQFQRMHFDQCILGVCALDAASGVTVFEYDDAEFKQALIGQSEQVIVVLTSDKTPGVARYRIAGCDSISDLVLEHGISDTKITPFTEAGIKIHQAARP